jgi:hypothetical protein
MTKNFRAEASTNTIADKKLRSPQKVICFANLVFYVSTFRAHEKQIDAQAPMIAKQGLVIGIVSNVGWLSLEKGKAKKITTASKASNI